MLHSQGGSIHRVLFTCSHFMLHLLNWLFRLVSGLYISSCTVSLCIPTSSWLARQPLLYLITIKWSQLVLSRFLREVYMADLCLVEGHANVEIEISWKAFWGGIIVPEPLEFLVFLYISHFNNTFSVYPFVYHLPAQHVALFWFFYVCPSIYQFISTFISHPIIWLYIPTPISPPRYVSRLLFYGSKLFSVHFHFCCSHHILLGRERNSKLKVA